MDQIIYINVFNYILIQKVKIFAINFFFYFFCMFLQIVSTFVGILFIVAFVTLAERKVLGAVQRRKGPMVTSFFGILQPVADGLKLFVKESLIPLKANMILYIAAPILIIFFSFIIWLVIPFGRFLVHMNINLGMLYIMAITTLHVFGFILAGWSSNSKYSFLGSIRSSAQVIAYEVSVGIILLTVFVITGSLNINQIICYQNEVVWLIWPLYPSFLLFFIISLAETNRPPFDLPEAEAELVAGYNVEYASIAFAFFFISEYASLITTSALIVTLFFGGWLPPFMISYENVSTFWSIFWFSIKTNVIIFIFINVRSIVPRYRYDQLMRLSWKVILPLSLSWLFFIVCIMYIFDIFPPYEIFLLFNLWI